MSRITNDVGALQGAVSDRRHSMFKDTFSLLGLVLSFFTGTGNWPSSPCLFSPDHLSHRQVWQKDAQYRHPLQITMGTLTTLLHETISGTRIVKAFGMEEYENKRFSEEK